MFDLLEVDAHLTFCMKSLMPLILKQEFQMQFEFTLDSHFNYGLLDSLSFSGVYLFEIKASLHICWEDWLSQFQENWEEDRFKSKAVPSLKKMRIRAHSLHNGWVPLYIGKSKVVSRRLKEHICLGLEKPTFALKLQERLNLHGESFRVSTIRLDVTNYDLIATQFETVLRDRLNPILGRQ